jgi:hypothetical protein
MQTPQTNATLSIRQYTPAGPLRWNKAGRHSTFIQTKIFLLQELTALEMSLLKAEAATGYFDIILCEHSDRITSNVWEIRDFLTSIHKIGLRPWSVQE